MWYTVRWIHQALDADKLGKNKQKQSCINKGDGVAKSLHTCSLSVKASLPLNAERAIWGLKQVPVGPD